MYDDSVKSVVKMLALVALKKYPAVISASTANNIKQRTVLTRSRFLSRGWIGVTKTFLSFDALEKMIIQCN